MNIVPTGKSLVLGSQSPRRAALLQDMGVSFRSLAANVNEIYPPDLEAEEIAEYLAKIKAGALKSKIAENEILITSDTVVWCEGESLAKAKNSEEAREMLEKLSGRNHRVITGVCLYSAQKEVLFSDSVKVYFNELKSDVIEYYLKKYQPFDKAGAYGIQEWIGMVGIRAIEGSYFTVMGLPTHRIFEELRRW